MSFNLTIDDLFKIQGLYRKIHDLVKNKPEIKHTEDLLKIENLFTEYKNDYFQIRNIDDEMCEYLLNTINSNLKDDKDYLDSFISCISILNINNTNLKRIKEKFGYSQIFKIFKKLIITQKYKNHKIISLIIKLLNNPSLCFNNVLPIITRINNYVKKGIDKNFITCITILRAVAEEGTLIENYCEYFTGLISFLVDIAINPKNFIFFDIDEIEQLLDTIEKLVHKRKKNIKLSNISIGIFLKLQEELFISVHKDPSNPLNKSPEISNGNILENKNFSKSFLRTGEEQLALGSHLKIMTVIYSFTYESGCRMYDYNELFNLALNLNFDMDLPIKFKYEFLDLIFPDYLNEIENTEHEKDTGHNTRDNDNSRSQKNNLEKYPSNTNSNISLVNSSVLIEKDMIEIVNDEKFTEILIYDLKKSIEITKILEKIKNLSFLINLPILVNFAIENYKEFIKFFVNNNYINSGESYLFAKYISSTDDEDALLLFTFYLSSLENITNYRLLMLLFTHNSERYFEDIRVKKRISLIFNLIIKLDLKRFSNFFAENIFKLDLITISLFFVIFREIDIDLLTKLSNFTIKSTKTHELSIKHSNLPESKNEYYKNINTPNNVINDENYKFKTSCQKYTSKMEIKSIKYDQKLFLALLAFIFVERNIDPLTLNIEISYPLLIIAMLFELKSKLPGESNDISKFNNNENFRFYINKEGNDNSHKFNKTKKSSEVVIYENNENNENNENLVKCGSVENLICFSENKNSKKEDNDEDNNIDNDEDNNEDNNINNNEDNNEDNNEELSTIKINEKLDNQKDATQRINDVLKIPQISENLKNLIIHFLIFGNSDEVENIKLLYKEFKKNENNFEKSEFIEIFEEIEFIYTNSK
ncbi:hypothetical protein DMUE_0786 [Dictyocoela muelleri]|nr:hypothetical protein DMUE_0786 [Dictyocoela muelleri]